MFIYLFCLNKANNIIFKIYLILLLDVACHLHEFAFFKELRKQQRQINNLQIYCQTQNQKTTDFKINYFNF